MYGIYGGSHGDRHGHDSSSMYLMHSAIPEHPPPQPAQWLTYYTPEGHPYYYNILTKTTQVSERNNMNSMYLYCIL